MIKERYGIIYLINNKINNKIYIGQTINDFDRRYDNNLEKRTSNEHLKRSIHKYGIENFEIDKEFDIAYSKEGLDKLEDMYIKIYNTIDPKYGYNNKTGGANGKPTDETRKKLSKSLKGKYCGENHPNYGKKMAEEQKEKIRNSLKGEKSPNYGKHLSNETKNKIRDAHKGKQHTDETKIKISMNRTGKCLGVENGFYGKRHSKETIEKNRISHMGKNNVRYGEHLSDKTKEKIGNANGGKNNGMYGKLGENNPSSKKVICITTNKIFESMTNASKYYGCSLPSISICCKGKRKSAGKLQDGTRLKWMYYDEYIKQQNQQLIHNENLGQAI
jgi:group I intron endonuclease